MHSRSCEYGYRLPLGRQVGRFETEVLTPRRNRKALMNLPSTWLNRAAKRHPLYKLILDLYSSLSETHARQEGSA